ncbi:MAG: hypothetical protein LLG40_06815 [Deltaproteobacteria bacterium]|nr:hypothetical protein [Deltaproteobacteria bacterium]
MKTKNGKTIRLFIFDEDAYDEICENYGEFVETDLETFKKAEGKIEIERDTISQDGISQIRLTRIPSFIC